MRKPRVITGVVAFAGAAVIAGTVAGCSQKAQEPFRDSSVSSHSSAPARVIEYPDGFANIAAKCDGPNMVYSPFHGDGPDASPAVAPNDPRCKTAG